MGDLPKSKNKQTGGARGGLTMGEYVEQASPETWYFGSVVGIHWDLLDFEQGSHPDHSEGFDLRQMMCGTQCNRRKEIVQTNNI